MRKRIEIEGLFCDNCKELTSWLEPCLGGCGLEVCWKCRSSRGFTYQAGVFSSGGGDGFYCMPCDQRLSESHNDPRHVAYQGIRALRDEYEKWSLDFNARKDAAQNEVSNLRGGR